MPLSRRSAEFWAQQRQQFDRYSKRPLRHFEKYARWYANDFAEIPYRADMRGDGAMGEIDSPALANLTNLATRTFRGDLYCRNPRFLVRPPGGYNRVLFTPLLARCETTLLNDAAEETHLYTEMQLCILDFILAPYMVGRADIGFSVAAEMETIERSRLGAQVENQKFEMLGVKPRVHDDDYHPEHIEQHEVLLAEWQRTRKVPDAAIRYLQKHIEKHWEAMPYCRPGETRRNQSVTFRRVNPLLYSFDIFNTQPGQRTWVGESFLMRIEDAKSNPEYSAKAKGELAEIKQIYRHGDDAPSVRAQFDVKGPDPMFRCFEYIDFITGDKILIAEGGTIPLEVRPWGHADILPGGPFIEASLLEHPLHNYGISSPHIYAKHQELASAIAEINSETVLRSLPIQGVDGRAVGSDEVGEIQKQLVGGMVVFKNMPEGKKIQDAIFNVPPVEVPAQNAAMEAFHQAMIEKNNGGPARMGGGDRSATATASEVVSAANAILTDDAQAKMDEFLRQLGVSWQRLMRKYYDRGKVAEIFGEDALLPEGWPVNGFATRDILMDRGTSVVPGSTRRNNSTVESKILQDQIMAVTPLVQAGILPPEFLIELVRRSNEALGVFGLDYEGAMQTLVEQQANALMQGGDPMAEGGGDPEAGPGAGGQRMSEMSEPSASGQIQGQSNVGGGRAGARSQLRGQRKQREAMNA